MAIVVASVLPISVRSQTLGVEGRTGVVGAGDVLRIRIWREPDMSGEFPITADGRVVLPRLGELDVTAVPADSLQSFLTDRYRVYLNNPSIEVVLLRRVTITGAVRNPGVYPLAPTMTISDALALAGGPAEDGKRDKVEIRRRDRVIAADLRSNRMIADAPIQSGDELYVPSKTWIGRNPWVLSGVLSALTAVVVTRASR